MYRSTTKGTRSFILKKKQNNNNKPPPPPKKKQQPTNQPTKQTKNPSKIQLVDTDPPMLAPLLQAKLSISPSHSILTSGQPVPVLTDTITPGYPLDCQLLSHWYDSTPKKSRLKQNSNPGSSAQEADALTTRPTRRCLNAVNMDLS